MLTKEQKIKLKEFQNNCSNKSLKRVINRAFPKFLNDEIIPTQKYLGVNYDNETLTNYCNQCCLLGAALLDKKTTPKTKYNPAFLLGIKKEDMWEIMSAFDGNNNSETEIGKNVFEIRKIIFGK